MEEQDARVAYTVKEMLALMDQRAELREQRAEARHDQLLAKVEVLTTRVAEVERVQAKTDGEAKGTVDTRGRIMTAAVLGLMLLMDLPNIVATWAGKGHT